MKEFIIKQYIDKITKKDVYDFGLKNNITLNNNNLDIIYNCIKKDWKQIVFGDVTPILIKLKIYIISLKKNIKIFYNKRAYLLFFMILIMPLFIIISYVFY